MLVVVQQELSIEFVLFGLYAVFGLVGGAAIYYGRTMATEQFPFNVDRRTHRTGVYVSSALTVALVAITDEPLLVVPGLVIGFALVIRQLFAYPDAVGTIPQLVALYLLSPITKYVTAGIYIGHGDVLPHTRLTEQIMTGGTISAIAGSSYFDFPGLHLLAATVSSLTGLGAYDGLMLTGLVAYSLLIPAVYVLAKRITDDTQFALMAALAVVILDDLSFYVSYVFPQSLATVLVIVLALLASLVDTDSIRWPVSVAFTIVLGALVFTHHLTHLLFLPLIVVVATLYAGHGKQYAKALATSRQMALFIVAEVVIFLTLVRVGFFSRIIDAAILMVQGGLYGGYTESVTLWLGRSEPHPVATAFQWLLSPYSLYLMLLLMVFSLGVVTLIRDSKLTPRFHAVAWAGILAAVLVFETPISIKSMIRIRMPWLLVFAVVLAIGLVQLRRYIDTSRSSQVFFAIIVLLAAMGPVVTADNYYNLDPRLSTSTSYSETEYSELRAVSSYIGDDETSTTTFSETSTVMGRHGVSDLNHPELRGGNLVIPAGYMVYRSTWPDQEVTFTTTDGDELYGHTMYISDDWLSEKVDTENKVYSAGGTGILWNASEREWETNSAN